VQGPSSVARSQFPKFPRMFGALEQTSTASPQKIELPAGATAWLSQGEVIEQQGEDQELSRQSTAAATGDEESAAAPKKVELSPCLSSPGPFGRTPSKVDFGVEALGQLPQLPQLPKFPLLLSEALSPRSPRAASPQAVASAPMSPEVPSMTADGVDARTPKRIELPARLASFDTYFENRDEEHSSTGQVPRSPPPSEPPAVSIALSDSLPPSPPPALPGFLGSEQHQHHLQQSPSSFVDALMGLPTSPSLPGSPTPAISNLLEQATAEGLEMAIAAAAEIQAVEMMQQADMMQWWGADFTQYAQEAEFAPYPAGEAEYPDYAAFHGAQLPAGLPSKGSALHGTGRCRPCAWFWKAAGCQNGDNCGHCHLCPEGETKSRKKAKQTLARLGMASPSPADALKEAMIYPSFFPGVSPMTSPVAAQPVSSEQASTSMSGTASISDEERVELVSEAAPGLDAQQLPSQGSLLHGIGECRPCTWYWKPVGCQNDKECSYCHLCPETEVKKRKKTKQTMLRNGMGSPIASPPGLEAEAQEPKFSLSLASLI